MQTHSTTTRSLRKQKPNGHVSRGDKARFLFERGHVHVVVGGRFYEEGRD